MRMRRAYRNAVPLGARPGAAHITGMQKSTEPAAPEQAPATKPPQSVPPGPKEIGGPKGPEPTRYGDWEQKGRCTDF